MQVNIEEFSRDPVRYVNLSQGGEIMIEKDGENIARITSAISPRKKALENLLKLQGILSSSKSPEAWRAERLMEKYGPLE